MGARYHVKFLTTIITIPQEYNIMCVPAVLVSSSLA